MANLCCASRRKVESHSLRITGSKPETLSVAAENELSPSKTEQKQKGKCLQGHGLFRFRTAIDGYSCDICKAVLPCGSIMWGGCPCNFDVCVTCNSQADFQSRFWMAVDPQRIDFPENLQSTTAVLWIVTLLPLLTAGLAFWAYFPYVFSNVFLLHPWMVGGDVSQEDCDNLLKLQDMSLDLKMLAPLPENPSVTLRGASILIEVMCAVVLGTMIVFFPCKRLQSTNEKLLSWLVFKFERQVTISATLAAVSLMLLVFVSACLRSQMTPGLEVEEWSVLVKLFLMWSIAQALLLKALRPIDKFTPSAFGFALLLSFMPYMSDGFDTFKNLQFATMAIFCGEIQSKLIGFASIMHVLLIRAYMLFDDDLRLELQRSYLSVFSLLPQQHQLTTSGTGHVFLRSIWGCVRLKCFMQSRPSKMNLYLSEDPVQLALALAFLFVQKREGREISTQLCVFNIIMPVVRLIISVACYSVQDFLSIQNIDLIARQLRRYNAKDKNSYRLWSCELQHIFKVLLKHPEERIQQSFVAALQELSEFNDDVIEPHPVLFQALAKALNVNTSIQRVAFSSSYKLGAEGTKTLCESMKVNTSITCLHLWWNQVGDEGAGYVSRFLENNTSLRQLNLNGNHIGNAGIKTLANSLKVNSTLICLALLHNNIGDEGAMQLAASLRVNHHLQTISLGSNNIGDQGASALAETLTLSTSLRWMSLNSNEVGDEGARAIFDALQVNRSLVRIELLNNPISKIETEKLVATTKANPSMEIVV